MLTEDSFNLLLDRLDPDPSVAASKYEDLRLKIVHLLRWRGCTEADSDELADVTLDRIAMKIAGGEIVENLNAFAAGVARFVYLEHSRKNKTEAVGDDLPETPVEPDIEFADGDDPRIRCMRRCFSTSFDDHERDLVLGYYDTEAGEKTKEARRRLAESLGFKLTVLKVRACRLRMRLEKCITDCVARVTKSHQMRTNKQEVV